MISPLPPEGLQRILYQASKDHREGLLKKAEQGYRLALTHQPDNGSVWNALGVVLEGQGLLQEALHAYEKAVCAREAYPQAYFNLGRVKQISGDLEGALAAYQALLKAVPEFAPGWNNLGNLLRELGELRDGILCLERAVTISPEQPSAWNNLGVALDQTGRTEAAIKALQKALELSPHYKAAMLNLAQIHQRLENFQRAEELYKKVLELDPSDEQARFLLHSIHGENIPSAAPLTYVQKVFDSCAHNFEETLVKKLSYRTPKVLFEMLRPFLREAMDILDLGCGTGLGSELYRPWARRLIGMDASPKMLEKAKDKGTYDRLIQQDILSPWDVQGEFDLICSCDCFVYLGDLYPVLEEALRHLKNGGLMAFSVEELPGRLGDYRLFPTGRYAHSKGYLESVLSEIGFSLLFVQEAEIRQEGSRPVKGLLLGARVG